MQLSRKRKTKEPCATCRMNPELCICEFIPSLDLKTRVCLVVHARELKRTTNTGTLALKALPNSEMRVRGGDQRDRLDLNDLLSGPYRTLLFFPSDEAIELTPEFVAEDSRPIQLIVPDGNWRQASKVNTRYPELAHIPRVMIKTANCETQYLRKETTPEGMATLQAIAEALGAIEGAAVRAELMNLYQAKLQKTLIGRGVMKPEDFTLKPSGSRRLQL